MAHISTIGAGIYSTLAFRTTLFTGTPTITNTNLATESAAGTGAISNTFSLISNIREMPAVGTPANIVNVPRYGSDTTLQVAAQADAPTLEFTLNYVPSVVAQQTMQAAVANRTTFAFRLRLANGSDGAGAAVLGSTVQFDDFAFNATVASFLVTPSLSDSTQATMTLALTSDITGPLTAV